MEPITLELTREEAMTLETILDAHKRQAPMTGHSHHFANKIQRTIRKALDNGN